VTWQTGQSTFWVSVVDDGRGFDPSADRPEGHFGLTHLEERAARLGGRLTLDSGVGRGTRLSLEAPWMRPEPRAVASAAPPVH
jgi:signal transduction histidine kinase